MEKSKLCTAWPAQAHRTVTPAGPYSEGAPSVPYITLLPMGSSEAGEDPYTVKPCPANLSALRLTREELRIVTRDQPQVASDGAGSWMYEQRRGLQPVLDYISIGPTSGIRDHDYLRQNSISMIMVIRDGRMANMPALSVTKACEKFQIEASFVNVDIENPLNLIRELPEIIFKLNSHMINLHNQSKAEEGVPRAGHILVTCDSGNDRSAAVVAAYIMAVYGASIHKTAQFLHRRRFSCSFDEETKRMLQTWEELLLAQAAVGGDQQNAQRWAQPPKSKRRLDDMLVPGFSVEGGTACVSTDADRFRERSFAPFRDSEMDME
ncbi:hypothetical protein LLEC1_06791 [Akanthomyces lecanii]|uniref:Tyrosine specific protein phosphatases domain-containing protein n=1 Tax=Cordyceps confragosa TaxID=2714763 RepID=A0A179IEB6_CORDF|nr:hypothetical protein LLEC1_06791 [Akanthomyces lecanii]